MSQTAQALVNLSNIAANWRDLDQLYASSETGAVVKANGYGHGSVQVASALAKAGCKTFFVAYAEEGAELRESLGPDADIYVFHGCTLETADTFKAFALRPVLNTLDQVRVWRLAGLDEAFGAVLHFDTGMNRLGLRMEQLDDTRTMLAGGQVDIVMSHLACAEDTSNTMNRTQLGRFLECCGYWPNARRSLSNTAGMHLGEDFAFDLCRPGIGLYGGGVKPARPGLTLTAPLLSVFTVPKASSTGYGATRRFATERRLATAALGYGDGFLRSASNSGFGFAGGKRCPIVGRVSMDLVTLDVTDVKETIAPGMDVEFIGEMASLEDQAAAAGSLGYELTTGLTGRVKKHWN